MCLNKLKRKIKIKSMFKKLLANLPYNPGLIDQVILYKQTLRNEVNLRRLGLLLLVLSLSLQVFIMLSSPLSPKGNRSWQTCSTGAPTNISCAAVKKVYSLPSVSPKTAVMVLGIIGTLAVYLLVRSRMMSRELEILRRQYLQSGEQ